MRRMLAILLLLTGCGSTAAASTYHPPWHHPAPTDPSTTTTTVAPTTTTAPRVIVPATVPRATVPVPATMPRPVHSVSLTGVWQCIGHWESGNNPAENTGNGYYGEWQFLASTWVTVMQQMYGKNAPYQGYPYAAAAPEGFQLRAAQFLQAESGWGQWSTHWHCGV